MWNVVPIPTSLATSIHPWCCCTMPKTVASPIPVPFPMSFVVKNGSKMRGRFSGGIPQPLSLTLKQANDPDRASGLSEAMDSFTFTREVSMTRWPPFGMASREFTARFITTWSSMPASAWT